MKIGLFFGTFNPLHIGHKTIASYIADYTDIDRVIFVISPMSPFKQKEEILEKEHRFKIIKMGINDNRKLQVTDIEFNMPQPSYTFDTLTKIKSQNPENDYIIIMGADNLNDFYKWKNYKQILENCNIYIFPRPGFKIEEKYPNIKLIEGCPQMNISSSIIRQSIKSNIDVSYLMPEKSWQYISLMNFYK